MVICSARQILRDFAPFVPILFMSLYDGLILLRSPLVLFDVRIQVIVPSFTTLLSDPSRQRLGNMAPIFCTELLDIFRQLLVFLDTPGTFDHRWVEYFLPSV